MATTYEVETEILAKMRPLFHCPRHIEEPDKALAQYGAVLMRFDGEALRHGWSKVLADYRGREWPPISVILRHVKDAAGTKAAQHKIDPLMEEKLRAMGRDEFRSARPKWGPDAERYSNDWHWVQRETAALECPLAHPAAREGWLAALVDFSVMNGCLPDATEINGIREAHAAFLRDVADVLERREKISMVLSRGLLGRNVALAERVGMNDTPAHKALARFEARAR